MNKKVVIITVICASMLVARGFAQKEHHEKEEKPQNLKVLPKSTTEEDLHKIMRGYSQSLGVRCGHCHVSHKVEGQEKPKWDFAADDKPEKGIARDMIKMVASINKKYISKMDDEGRPLAAITCVTCHNGRVKPIVSVDSLKAKQ